MLQLKDVTISYKNEPIVEHFNLNMKQGQIVSLVGESGSGKTTVIRAILGLLAGAVKYQGEVFYLKIRICFLIQMNSGENSGEHRFR